MAIGVGLRERVNRERTAFGTQSVPAVPLYMRGSYIHTYACATAYCLSFGLGCFLVAAPYLHWVLPRDSAC